jgi:hypothetical protein
MTSKGCSYRSSLIVMTHSQRDVKSACVEDARTLRASRRYLHGDPDNVIAFTMVAAALNAIIRQALSKAFRICGAQK